LGKLLHDRSREPEHEAFLEFLYGVIRGYSVDALLVSGDVFDSATPPKSAERAYYNFLSRVYRDTRCVVVVTAGNHDSPLQLEAPGRALQEIRAWVRGAVRSEATENLIVLPDRNDPRVVVAAIPFLRERDLRTWQPGLDSARIQRELTHGIRLRYQESAEAVERLWSEWGRRVPALAMGHLTVSGAAHSESERTIHIGGLGAVGTEVFPELFGYVALGHIHKPQQWGRVAYSGSPIPLSFGERKDRKRLVLLDVEESGCRVASVEVPRFRELIQVQAKRSELSAQLSAASRLEAVLCPWVEVLVSDSAGGELLNQEVHAAAEGLPIEVLKVVAGMDPVTGGRAEEERVDLGVLDSPVAVFDRLLGESAQFDEGESAALRTAFAELLSMRMERERGGAD
jgi:exonuclease SbcD